MDKAGYKCTVSVIMANFNKGAFIDEAINSVIEQSFADWELIICDDSSTDNSLDVIKNYLSDERLKLVSGAGKPENVKGPAFARNRALQVAEGRYIAFLDSDDKWHKDKLDKQLKFMRENSCGFCFTGYDIITENSEKAGETLLNTDKVCYKGMLGYNKIGCLTAVIDRKHFGDFLFPVPDKNRHFHEDYALWLKLLKNGGCAYFLPEVLGSYRLSSDAITKSLVCSVNYYWNVLRCSERMELLRSARYLASYLLYGLQSRAWLKFKRR